MSAPSTFSAPSTQSAPYFATNSPDEAVAAQPAAPLPPDAQPRRRRAGRHAATTPEQPFTQATQAVPALTQPAVTPAAPTAMQSAPALPVQAAAVQQAVPAQQVTPAAQAPAAAPSQAGAPSAMRSAAPPSPLAQAAAPSSPQGPYGAGANSSPAWQAPRNPSVRYDVVPNQSLWEDEEDDDTNPTGVPAI